MAAQFCDFIFRVLGSHKGYTNKFLSFESIFQKENLYFIIFIFKRSLRPLLGVWGKYIQMKILLLEPFFTGSHQKWAEDFKRFSKHEITILSLKGKHWKWRMHAGAIDFAKQFERISFQPDLILASDMLDLNLFLSLTRKQTFSIPTAVYFHENQLTYPWSPSDEDVKLKRDNHYAFINFTSALVADKILFNSEFHKQSFLAALPNFLKQFPDNRNLENIKIIEEKSHYLPLGIDLERFQEIKKSIKNEHKRAVILWNHRWEFDKDPEEFFKALFVLKEKGIEFKLIVLGEKYTKSPAIFDEAKENLKQEIIHWGFVDSFEKYANLLCQADLIPVTSKQDFFGMSLIEAMACDVVPLLPKRLAFPEHIPEEFHITFFYDGFEDLVNRLQRRILNLKPLRKQSVSHFITKYDWKTLIEKYDKTFENI